MPPAERHAHLHDRQGPHVPPQGVAVVRERIQHPARRGRARAAARRAVLDHVAGSVGSRGRRVDGGAVGHHRRARAPGAGAPAGVAVLLEESDVAVRLMIALTVQTSLRRRPGLCAAQHLGKAPVCALRQLVWCADLDDLPLVHHHHAVALEHRVQPVRDDQHGARAKDVAQRRLHLGVRRGVDRGRGLVEAQHCCAASECTREAHELLLPERHLGTLPAHGRVQAERPKHVAQMAQVDQPPQRVVVELAPRVDVVAERADDECRRLRDDRKPRPHFPQRQPGEVVTVDRDCAAADWDKPEECREQSRLGRARAPDDADLLAGRDQERHAAQCVGGGRRVAQPHVAELDGAVLGPRFAGLVDAVAVLGRQVDVLAHALDRHHLALGRDKRADEAAQQRRHGQRVRQSEAGRARRQPARRDGQQSSELIKAMHMVLESTPKATPDSSTTPSSCRCVPSHWPVTRPLKSVRWCACSRARLCSRKPRSSDRPRMTGTPSIVSEKCAYSGERAIDSRRLSSRDVMR
eukprot:Unigene15400_Nuclearia_a/m.46021 Unigene15400_Nuclearia_a/g.46021  ORF Unigene15400_Nuclearia_a/g.46021 Unigene15400_Nuclearia_a/m.46021 type:complete len:522 (+) Unigene15400_Nuclearia_a:1282-2847(+)